MKRNKRLVQRAVLQCVSVLGKIIKRPSESLLTELARKDRPGASVPESNPILKASDHIQAGQGAFESGDYAEALHRFSEAIRLAPDAPWAWHGKGDALQLSEQPRAALEAYERACRLDPETGLHHAGRANSLTALGQSTEAQEAWETALSLDDSLEWMRTHSKKP